MFNLAIDSKLRGCDLVSLHVRDVTHGNQILPRAMVIQRKTQRPVQFELTEPTRSAVLAWIEMASLRPEHYLFPSRLAKSLHVSTRQYARIVHQWVADIGLDSTVYGTHTMRRTKATLIYKRTKNLRAVQPLLGHTKLDYLPQYIGWIPRHSTRRSPPTSCAKSSAPWRRCTRRKSPWGEPPWRSPTSSVPTRPSGAGSRQDT